MTREHRERSPGGTRYRLVSTYDQRVEESRGRSPDRNQAYHGRRASNGHRSRREAYGYVNPAHSHGNMIPHFRNAAVSPVPRNLNPRQERRHLMGGGRHFRTSSPGGTDTGVVRGHGGTVLGHQPSAGEDWNREGHRRSSTANRAHNRRTSTYHGLESRARSDASGAHDPRYQSPRPSRGSHPSYYHVNNANFQGGFGPYYESTSNSSTPSRASSLSPSRASSSSPPRERQSRQRQSRQRRSRQQQLICNVM